MRMPVLMVVWSSAGAGSSAQSAFCNVAPHHQLDSISTQLSRVSRQQLVFVWVVTISVGPGC